MSLNYRLLALALPCQHSVAKPKPSHSQAKPSQAKTKNEAARCHAHLDLSSLSLGQPLVLALVGEHGEDVRHLQRETGIGKRFLTFSVRQCVFTARGYKRSPTCSTRLNPTAQRARCLNAFTEFTHMAGGPCSKARLSQGHSMLQHPRPTDPTHIRATPGGLIDDALQQHTQPRHQEGGGL